MAQFYKLLVSDLKKETPSCVSVFFDIPENLKEDFKFKAGQYLTLKIDIADEEVRRAYSIFTPPFSDQIGVSIKKVINGKMSNYIVDKLKVGDQIDVMIPEGKFVVKPQIDSQRDHYFIAAGSGITPILSMIKTILEEEPKSTVYLLYGNRDEDNIIFRSELEAMKDIYNNQFFMDITLSSPTKEKSNNILGTLGSRTISWNGQKGRLNGNRVINMLNENPPRSNESLFYICGPEAMMEDVKSTLIENKVSSKKIFQEYFTVSKEGEKVDGKNSILTTNFDGEDIRLELQEHETILDAMLDAGHDVPYSCTGGSCSSCIAKVVKGSAKMKICLALDENEVEEGFILTCQAQATSKEIEIEYE